MAILPVKQIAKPVLWTKNFMVIMIVNIFVFTSYQMLLPTMPVHIRYLGASEDIVGLIIGIFTIITVVLRPFVGHVLDTKSRRGVYLLGLIIITLATFAYNFLFTISMLFALRVVHGIGWGIATTASRTVATDVIPKSRLGEGMGFYGLTTVISMAIAPTAGFKIIQLWGFHTLFQTSALLVIIAAVLALFIKYQPIMPLATGQKTIQYAMFEKEAYKPTVIIFTITLTYGAIVNFISIYAAQCHIENIGIFFTAYAVTQLGSRPLSGCLADKYGNRYAIIPGIIFIGLTMVILFFAQNLLLFVIAAICYGIGFGAVQPSLQAMAVRNVSPQRRGAANATFLSGFDLGIGFGSILWGIAAQAFGYSAIYLLAVIPVIISFFLYLFLDRPKAQ